MDEITKQLLNYGFLGVAVMVFGLHIRELRKEIKDLSASKDAETAKHLAAMEALREAHHAEIAELHEKIETMSTKHGEVVEAMMERHVAKAENYAQHGAEIAAKSNETAVRSAEVATKASSALDALIKSSKGRVQG